MKTYYFQCDISHDGEYRYVVFEQRTCCETEEEDRGLRWRDGDVGDGAYVTQARLCGKWSVRFGRVYPTPRILGKSTTYVHLHICRTTDSSYTPHHTQPPVSRLSAASRYLRYTWILLPKNILVKMDGFYNKKTRMFECLI